MVWASAGNCASETVFDAADSLAGTRPLAEARTAAVTTSLVFPVTTAPAGTWRVRVRVDSADSPLDGAPTVTLP